MKKTHPSLKKRERDGLQGKTCPGKPGQRSVAQKRDPLGTIFPLKEGLNGSG